MFEKAQEQGELRSVNEQGDYVTSRIAGRGCPKIQIKYADVAELADALDSGSSESNFIWVQVPSSAPKTQERVYPSPMFFIQIIS